MRSLRARVAAAAAAGVLLVLATAGIVVTQGYARHLLADFDESLSPHVYDAARQAFGSDMFGISSGITLRDHEIYARAYHSETGELVVEGDGPESLPRGPEGFTFQHDAAGVRWRVYVGDAGVGGGRFGHGATPFQLAKRTAPLDRQVARARMVGGAVTVAGALLAGGFTWLLLGSALVPLVRLREHAAELVESPDMTRRLPTYGPPEIGDTAVSLNRMLDRTQIAYRQARSALDATRTFTADAGHELRTPLTSLRANLDVLARDGLNPGDRERALRDSLTAHARLTHLIEGLQTLARGDAAGVAGRTGTLDLAELADAAVLDARRRHPGVAFEFEGSASARVSGDENGLRMLLDNLLENAAVHGGSRVRVHVREGDGFAQLSVSDDGPGIPHAERTHVFDRFARGSAARNGTGSGLGLAIAAQQAELHGSRLKLTDSPLGGARFELLLSAPSSS